MALPDSTACSELCADGCRSGSTQRAADSRYAKIMNVMRESESGRPTLRRLGDRLGAVYTPVALTVAVLAWIILNLL